MKTIRQVICLLLAAALLLGICPVALAQPAPVQTPPGNVQLTKEQLRETVRTGGGIPFELEMAAPDGEAEPSSAPAPAAGRAHAGWSAEYYRDQLPEGAQAIYDAILTSPLREGPAVCDLDLASCLPASARTVPGTTTATYDGRMIHLSSTCDRDLTFGLLWGALDALLYDHPELSWLYGTSAGAMIRCAARPEGADEEAIQALEPGETYTFAGDVYIDLFTWGMDAEGFEKATTSPEGRFDCADTGDLADIEAAVASARQEIGTLGGQSEAGRVQAIHDWLCGHAEYADKESARFKNSWRGYQTAYSALVEGVTVCAGYAKAFKLLCDAYGIPCVVVHGTSKGEGHAWNDVLLSGRWYGVDVTWADQGTWISPRDFLKGSRTFFQDHTEEELSKYQKLLYPPLSVEDFDPDAPPAEIPTQAPTEAPARQPQLTWEVLDSAGKVVPSGASLPAGEVLSVRLQADGADISARLALSFPTGPHAISDLFQVADGETIVMGGLQLSQMPSGPSLTVTDVSPAGVQVTPASWSWSVVVEPTQAPTQAPTEVPTQMPTQAPTQTPTQAPTQQPTQAPTQAPTQTPTQAPTAGNLPAVRPAPGVTAPTGYEAGRVNGRTYYAKTSGAKVQIYLRSAAGQEVRVAVPYVSGGRGERYYPISCGGETLFPRLQDGKLECYCRYENGLEIPVLRADGLQLQGSAAPLTGLVNGRPYTLEASGAKIKVYLRSSAGKMVRVAVPYQSAGSARFYPVVFGGTTLVPVIENGKLVSYNACQEDGGSAVLVPVS